MLFTPPNIQKEILHVFSTTVKKIIREEIGEVKFCIIVDEARDESNKEQMAIVLRFIDKDGFVREPFFGLVLSDMRGEWNGLQASILNDCPYV